MALERIGHNYTVQLAAVRYTDITDTLAGLTISSELLESTILSCPVKINGLAGEVTLPDTFIEGLYGLFNYNPATAKWEKVSGYTQTTNKLTLTSSYRGLLLAFPFDAFRDSYYADGEYTYEMSLARADTNVYRDIVISSSSFKQSDYIDLSFSFSENGPWLQSISSRFLFSTFYMRVRISNIKRLGKAQVIPSELIAISCWTCE